MSTAARILLIGDHPEHLQARVSVMKHFWAVTTAWVSTFAKPAFDVDLVVDLVVVCETLPEHQRQHWVECVRREVPTMLVVKMNGYDSGPQAGADAVIDADHGPGALVSTIYELLTERGLKSRQWPERGDDSWLH